MPRRRKTGNAAIAELWGGRGIFEQYGVDYELGFVLPFLSDDNRPLENQIWREIARELSIYINDGNPREAIERELAGHPLDFSQFDEKAEPYDPKVLLAFRDVSLIAQAWIWGQKPTTNELPAFIAQPLIKLSKMRGGMPIAGYGEIILSNGIPTESLDINDLSTIVPGNFRVHNVFTTEHDEGWFIQVHLAVEVAGAVALREMAQIVSEVHKDSPKASKVLKHLRQVNEAITQMRNNMLAIRQRCSAEFFFNKYRFFLDGTQDLGNGKKGLIYRDTSDETPRILVGGSGAQTPLFPALDALFGVKHEGTQSSKFLETTKAYFLPSHGNFIEQAAKISDQVRKFMFQNPMCAEAFNLCLQNLDIFRGEHYGVVNTYIVAAKFDQTEIERLESESAPSADTSTQDDKGASAFRDLLTGRSMPSAGTLADGERGTGSSDFGDLLAEMKEDTLEAIIPVKQIKRGGVT